MPEATIEDRVRYLEERISKLERVEKFLDERERRQKANIEKQNQSVAESQAREKLMRGLEKIPENEMKAIEQRLAEQEKQAGKTIDRRSLYLLYYYSAIDSSSDALRKLFKDRREWVEKNYCPFFVEIQHAMRDGHLVRLFVDSDALPITPSVLVAESDGTVQSCFIGYGEVNEFLTKGGAHE